MSNKNLFGTIRNNSKIARCILLLLNWNGVISDPNASTVSLEKDIISSGFLFNHFATS